MRTIDTVLKRGRLIWDRQVLPDRLFAERLRSVRQGMAEQGLGALFVYGDVRRHGTLTWLTNYLPSVRDALLLMPGEDSGTSVLFVNVALRDVPAARDISATLDLRSFEQLDPDAMELLASLRSRQARVGLAEVRENMPVALWERLFPGADALPQWTSVTRWLEACRFLKSNEELQAIRQAAAIGRNTFTDWLRMHARPDDSRELEVAAALVRSCRHAGAEDVRVLVASGDGRSAVLGPPGQRILQPGERLAVYLAVQWHRYWAEIGRTVIWNGSGKELEAGRARECVRQAIERISRVETSGQLCAVPAQLGLGAGLGAASLYPECAGIGLDLEEALVCLDPQAPPVGATIAVRWGDASPEGPQLWAETVECSQSGARILTGPG